MQSAAAQGSADAVFERMRLYANALERTSPPVFVGRKDELDTLRAAVELVVGDNPRGMTHIVQGVPGAGKSSLCEEFLGAMQGTGIAGKVVLCAKMDPSVLDVPPLRLVAAVTEELRRTHAQLAGRRGLVAASRRHAGLVFDVAGQLVFKTGEHRLNARAHGLTDESPLTTCINAHADHIWPDNAAIVLAFDEMQECPVTDRTKAALRAFCLVLCAHRQMMPAGDLLRDAIADLHNGNKGDYYRKRLGSTLRLHGTVLGGLTQAASNAPLPLPEVAAG